MKRPVTTDAIRHIIVGCALMAIGAGLLASCGQSDQARSWDQSVAYAASLVPELEKVEYERVPLNGDAHAGSAFEDYDRAIALLLPSGDPEAPDQLGLLNLLMAGLEGHINGSIPLAAEKAEAAASFLELPRIQSALEALQRGAHRSDAKSSINWASGTAELDDVTVYRVLALTAVVQASFLEASGHQIEAVKLRIDAAQMGLDQLHTPALTHASVGLGNVLAAFIGPFGAISGPGTGLDHLAVDARRLLANALDETIPQVALSPLAGAGDFVRFMRHAQAFDRLPVRYSIPNDGELDQPELTDWLAERRSKTEDDLVQVPYLKTLKQVRQRLACLQLALRVDLDSGAARSASADGRPMVADVTADEIIVRWADDEGSNAGEPALVLKRSMQR